MHVCLGTHMPSCMCGVRGQHSRVISLLLPCRSCRGTQVTRFTGRILYTDIVNIIINIISVASLAHACWYFLWLLLLRVKLSVIFRVLCIFLLSFLPPALSFSTFHMEYLFVQQRVSPEIIQWDIWLPQYMILVYLFPRNPLD